MKDTHVLAAACFAALIAIGCVFIGYATDTFPKQKQRVITLTNAPTREATQTGRARRMQKKKPCPCCEEDFQKKLQQVIYESIEKKQLAVSNENAR